jgi:hypothetical protein
MVQHHIPEEQILYLHFCKTLKKYFSYLWEKIMLILQNMVSVTLQMCYCTANEYIHTAMNLSSSNGCKILSQKEKLKAGAEVSVGGTKFKNIMQTRDVIMQRLQWLLMPWLYYRTDCYHCLLCPY